MKIINREIWSLKENTLIARDDLDTPVDSDQVMDGGYAFSAEKPQEVSENLPIFNIRSINERMDDYKNINPNELKKSVDFVEKLTNAQKFSGRDISELIKNYLVVVQNLDKALEIAVNDITFFNNILKIQNLFKRVGVMNEDLVYFHADDATKDEYKLMSEDGTSLYTNVHGTVQPDDNNSLDERVKTFMPKSKSVSVKKNCRLAGKKDGTSDACNQGDIDALEFGSINENRKKYLGQCDKLRHDCEDNDARWHEMMKNKKPIPLSVFINGVDMSKMLDVDEKPIEYIEYLKKSDPETNTYVSNWGDKEVYFLQSAGFEFIFIDDNKSITESKEKKGLLKEEKVRYGVLMAYFDIPKWESIISKIKEEDLYDDGSGTFGREHEPHITVLYGFHDDVTKDDILPLIDDKSEIEVEVKAISLFENEKFDVVKFEVTPTEQLLKLREKMSTLPHTLTYKDYKPHMTLAYVKSGEGKKYKKQFENPVKLKSNKLVFSTKNKDKTNINLKDKSNDK